jgi:hypothetical protein
MAVVLMNAFFVAVAACAVVGLVSPKTVMDWRSPMLKNDSRMTGGVLYKTKGRTRVTCGVLLAMALFALIGPLVLD